MNIIILCKRRPQQKDLWLRPNGRFYNLALALAAAGHHVDLVLLSYKNDQKFVAQRDGLSWHSVNLLPNPLGVYHYTLSLARERQVTWIIGFSDIYFGVLAVVLASQVKAKSLVDAYDNYESYIPWFKPLHWLWRWALSRTDCVTAAGAGLLALMSQGRKVGALQAVLPMAADPQFKPMDKLSARMQLGLPLEKKLIGYCGSAHCSRDIEVFFGAINLLAKEHPDYAFVMTGSVHASLALPKQVIHLGYLPDAKMPIVVNALDLMVSVNKPSAFGNYSYPAKIYEALACGVPVIASATPSVSEVLGYEQEVQVPPGDVEALAARIVQLLNGERVLKRQQKLSWAEVAARLERLLGDNAH